MGRAPCCDKTTVKKGPWSPEEDAQLKEYIGKHGTGGNWIALPKKIGLKRCGKSCRLRWLNYLRPNLKHGSFSEEEENIICNLYMAIGSRWSVMAAQLPGRTDNDIKNYWNTRLKMKLLGTKNRCSRHSKHHQEHVKLEFDEFKANEQYTEVMNPNYQMTFPVASSSSSCDSQGSFMATSNLQYHNMEPFQFVYENRDPILHTQSLDSISIFQASQLPSNINYPTMSTGISHEADTSIDPCYGLNKMDRVYPKTVEDDLNTAFYPSTISDHVDCTWQDMLIGSDDLGLFGVQQGQTLFN